MGGKFINTKTSYTQMVANSNKIMKGLLDNPYYLFTDKKAQEVNYYNLNTTMTTLDEATRGNYSDIDYNSPLRFNKIIGFYLYGISKIEPNLDIGDFGLESSDITGEALVLPNTIVPYPGDFFYINELPKYLFKVTAVNPNTLDTGSTMYRVAYTLRTSDGLDNIEPQVVKKYKFIMESSGTNISTSIVEEEVLSTIDSLQDYATELKDYYTSMFYDSRANSFTYRYNPSFNGQYDYTYEQGDYVHLVNMQRCPCSPMGFKVYDPYLIEFIIRNKILSGATNYVYIEQQMFLNNTFDVDYARTIFSSLEENNLDKHYGRSVGNLLLLDQKLSIMYQYPMDYYYMEYHNLRQDFFYISIFDDPDFKNKIKEKKYTSKDPLKNIIIKYFNKEEITIDDLKKLEHVDYMENKEFYYMIPMVIYCIEQQMYNDMSSSSINVKEQS